ncbi:MAG TPA: hypothetical protein VKV74_17465 [Bryobacteraceae bacterium]|nr:hypothetical protein [Bryobacteraceae bacterium]
MALLQLNLQPSTKELRWFAGLWWPLICGLAGAALARKFRLSAAAELVWIAGGISAIAGLIAPRAIGPIHNGLLRLTYPIGFLLSYALLFLVYFFIFTPVGFLLRRFYDPMSRRFDRLATSYWTPPRADPLERYFRQF